ncbi:uncharacterized protein BT62DRAFT_963967 [Guyanagaster necrorhizus]|uniref:Uncharacterized protein n=1 Tax=Guyanagaster necrorhizus TaxID=856835 RepID=A0A9P7VYY1_9AGAR|nr:uncharacterized protein BT62DRAFT_963967 [Guyanagaster necrorhizus MCA 3950]KAG7449097.1 hypothetical protein BT62DRAFT_963967 [Guyanagaster necrorhizus MCA 3950]
MPSVRVRRSQYASLNDRPAYDEQRTLTNIFRRPTSEPASDIPEPATSPPASPVITPPSQTSSPLLTNSPTALTPAITVDQPIAPLRRGRPRAGSRVQDLLLSQSLRLSSLPLRSQGSGSPLRDQTSASSLDGSHRTTSPIHFSAIDGVLTIEGHNADIQVRSGDGEPGLVGSALSLPRSDDANASYQSYTSIDDHHHDDIVEHLDVIDPQVATVSNLTNAANSILIPPFSWYSRKPVVVLDPPLAEEADKEKGQHKFDDELDRHVDDVLRRPSKIRRSLKGVWSFLKTPMGIVAGIYGFCVVFWGAAIVLFLTKIINLHNADRQGFWVEVSSQVTNGLFTITGIGLIPSRVLDTYRVYKIWHYKRQSRNLRRKADLPPLFDEDDLPDPAYDPNYVHVLTEKEQNDLHRQQLKFQHHQTWYRPHGTATHRAFPINTALVICLFNDGNSFFQIILCGCMWGLNRFQRPAWTTGSLIPASFLCGIFSAVFIARGSAKTKRKREVEDRLRAALAMQDHEDDLPQAEATRSSQPDSVHSFSVSVSTEKDPHSPWSPSSPPEVIIEEEMTISAAAAAAEKRKNSLRAS